MSHRALTAAAERALLAPSIHNTQPWRFVLRPDGMDVRIDPTRQLAVLDPNGRQVHLSAGCALFNARATLASFGVPVQVLRLPDRSDPYLAARLVLDDRAVVPAEIADLDAMIPTRHSNRRQFSLDPVPDELVERLVAAAKAEGGVLHPIIEPHDRMAVARFSQRADAEQLVDPRYRAELRAWTTTDPDRRDGVRATAVPRVDGTSGDELPMRDFDTQGEGFLPAQTRSTARQCLFVLGTLVNWPIGWLEAGEALERVWLEITRAGYVASLFTQDIEVEALRSQLRHELRLDIAPQVVLRVGRAAPTAPSARRYLSEVLEDQALITRRA